jgi:pyroglutamyl-peptidase
MNSTTSSTIMPTTMPTTTPSTTASNNILITGFEPFNGEHINPSWECIKDFQGQQLKGGEEIHTLELPCAFDDAIRVLEQAVRQLQPQLVICVGQAGGRSDISLERVAINMNDARIPDNNGAQPIDRLIQKNGPVAYFSTLPVKAIVAALHKANIPASVSYTAGTYVCNHIFYALMHHAQAWAKIEKAGFIHIPYLPQQTCQRPMTPSMSPSIITEGLRLALETALNTQVDIHTIGGSLC